MMIEFLLICGTVFFFCIGLAECMHWIKMTFSAPEELPEAFYIVLIDGSDALQQINYLGMRYGWQGRKNTEHIAAVCRNIPQEDKRECLALAEKYGIFLCDENYSENI